MIPKIRKEAFKVLGLSESASTKEIRKAYCKLALKWHPDKWSDKSQEEQKTATEKFKEISVAYKISIGEMTEEFISKQPNDDWIDNLAEYFENWAKEFLRERYGSHLSEEEVDLFKALDDKDLAKTKILLEKVKNINSQTRPFDSWTGESMHYIVKNSCSNFESGWIELLEEVLSKYSANNSISAHNSSVELCSQLNAIDVNILMEGIGTPLYIACDLGNLDVISMLLKHGADPNTCSVSEFTPLYYALEKSKNDVVKVLFEHGAEIGVGSVEEKLIIGNITKYSQSTVEMLLPYASNRQKSKMLQCIAYSDSVETDHDIEIAKLLLKADADPKFCGQKEKGESNASASCWADFKKKSKLVKLFNEHKEKATNNNLHTVEKQSAQPPITDNKNHHSPQKQASGISPRVIGLALLFGAVGATLAAIGIIPEIVAIGVVATAVLLGIAGAALGGIVGYLTDITVNKCCNSEAVSCITNN